MKTAFQGRFTPQGGALGFSLPGFGFDFASVGAEAASTGFDWGSLFSAGLTTGLKLYEQKQIQEAAEEKKEAAEAQKAAIEAQMRASQEAAAEAERLRTEGPAAGGQVLGIPTGTLLLVGGGVAALVAILLLTRK